jgi:hypothetical protein
MAASRGVRYFCTTANSTSVAEMVPDNPLPDQVNPEGSDPEDTDSDEETDALLEDNLGGYCSRYE